MQSRNPLAAYLLSTPYPHLCYPVHINQKTNSPTTGQAGIDPSVSSLVRVQGSYLGCCQAPILPSCLLWVIQAGGSLSTIRP